MKFANLKKVQAKLKPVTEEQEVAGEAAALAAEGKMSNATRTVKLNYQTQGQAQTQPQLRTLTHGASAKSPGRVMTEAEAVARALAKAKGQ